MEEINHPDRYAGGKYECIEVMIDVFGVEFVKNFCVLNAFKYLWRHKQKGGTEDIKKAVWYLNEYIKLDETVPSVMVNRPVSMECTVADTTKINRNGTDYSLVGEDAVKQFSESATKSADKPSTDSDSEPEPKFHYEAYYDKELGINLPKRVYDEPRKKDDISDTYSDGRRFHFDGKEFV